MNYITEAGTAGCPFIRSSIIVSAVAPALSCLSLHCCDRPGSWIQGRGITVKKLPFIDNIWLGGVWLCWAVALFFFIRGHSLYCFITAMLTLSGLLLYFFYIRTGFFYMFGRKQTDPEYVQTVPAPEPSSSPAEDNGLHTSVDRTVVARNTVFTGDISMDGDILIYGNLRGNIHVREGKIHIMPGGRAEGELCAPEVIIDGIVEGSCEAKSVDILERGSLHGTLRYISLSVRHGGVFVGQSEKMKQEDAPVCILPFNSPENEDENIRQINQGASGSPPSIPVDAQ